MFLLFSPLLFLFFVFLGNVISPRKHLNHRIHSLYGSSDRQLRRTMGCLLGPAILSGNRVDILQNGDEIFPAMLKAIALAEKNITFETFIYWEGDIGRTFATALCEKARQGVKVHVLLDWIGSRDLDEVSFHKMEAAGISIIKYQPLRWYNLGRLNNRTHRKILVVDGKVGFTGGVGIADQWTGNAQSPDHWRDTHYQIEGPAVAQLQAAFLDNWHMTHPEVLHGEEYFPLLEPCGDIDAQVFKSSPEEGSANIRLMYMLAIAASRSHLQIAMAYFVPDRLAIRMFTEARARGVKVEIIVPGSLIDYQFARGASRRVWGKLLKAGVEIYEYQPTMYHCKYMIVDSSWVSVGSTNFDNRSFSLNREANVNIYDVAFAKKHSEIFEADKRKSQQISYSSWKKRPWNEKVIEKIAGVFRSQM